ncbi:ganglioside GM2 activator isoform X1 [Ciconia boyciana]|uniref:ganglioside GM2 activator isoform X1 n=1 Tax=Ciconia boyciana TaxID=52775 RepID=UPI003B9EEFF6
MLGAGLALALCALQLCPAALGGSQPQLLVERSGSRRLSKVRASKPFTPLLFGRGRGRGGGGPGARRREQPERCWQIGGFAWENCGDKRDPVVLQSLSVAPDPISIPGSLRISAAVSSNKTMAAPLKAVLLVEKALGDLWIQLPCIDQLGSCTYNDVCTILDNLIPPGTTCPEPLLTYGIPCHCPFKAGSYSLPASDFVLPEVELPAWMTNGNYRVRVAVSSGGEELACVKLAFSLQSQ